MSWSATNVILWQKNPPKVLAQISASHCKANYMGRVLREKSQESCFVKYKSYLSSHWYLKLQTKKPYRIRDHNNLLSSPISLSKIHKQTSDIVLLYIIQCFSDFVMDIIVLVVLFTKHLLEQSWSDIQTYIVILCIIDHCI